MPQSQSRPLWVQKYGGTSVSTPERIRSVARRIADARAGGQRSLIVVVSAMGATTDELIRLAGQVMAPGREPPTREMDMLLSTGERISMALLSMALSDVGVPALSLTGSQSGIVTDSHHRRARIKRILGDRVRAALDEGRVTIVAGFQGVSETKEITTLGRGGSDTTAVALAAAFGADRCEIFTDVDGVYSADPTGVPGARFLPGISGDLMYELALRGAGVLHPRCVRLALDFQVPLFVRNSLNFSSGTEVITMNKPNATTPLERTRVTGVTVQETAAALAIVLPPGAGRGKLNAIWKRLAESELGFLSPEVLEPESGNWTLRLFCERDALPEWESRLQALRSEGLVHQFQVHAERLPVSMVGSGIGTDATVISRSGAALEEAGISARMVAAGANVLTFEVPRDQGSRAVETLHREWVE